MGKSASGKDTIFSRLVKDKELGLGKVVPYTTRPVRSGEVNGRDYYFVTDAAYQDMCEKHQVIESRTYQTVSGPWHYFTADDGQIDLSAGSFIVIGTLEAYRQICRFYGRENVIPVYIEVEDGLRLERALAREKIQENSNYAELCRRFLADCEDFSEEKLAEAEISKRYHNIEADVCYREIKTMIKNYM